MLRIDNNILRIVLLGIGLLGVLFFVWPLAFRIINIGNLFGLACSIVLLGFVIFNRQISSLLDTLYAARVGKIAMRILSIIFLLGVLYCLVMSCMMLYAAHKKPKEQPQAVIVLGCKVRGTVPSLMLSRRIRAAYDILIDNPELIAVVSGGKGDNEEISEAQCMYNELTRMGIAPERILIEDQSTSTSENLRFSKKLLDEHGITGALYLATDGYHEMRAQVLAKKEGLPECFPVTAHTSWYLLPTYWIREWFGLAHAFVFGN